MEDRTDSPFARAPAAGSVPLTELPDGGEATVLAFAAGRQVASRLAAMGLTVGTSIRVLRNPGRGPLMVLVRDTRIALGRGEAEKVLVEHHPGRDHA
jgi:Fe2+ transport system protein FeoA